MKWMILLAAIILNAAANFFIKLGMDRMGTLTFEVSLLAKVITNPFMIAGVTSFGLSLAVYSVTLQKFELSVAYPLMTTSGFLLISICSAIWLKESFTLMKVLGMIVVLIGVFMISHESK